MNIYKISRIDPDRTPWDEWFGAIVCASDVEDAKLIHPDPEYKKPFDGLRHIFGGWVSSYNEVVVQFIGTADESIPRGVVLDSFNAG